MALIKTKNPFRNTRIAAGGGIWNALHNEHRILTWANPTNGLSFVFAHADDAHRAVEVANGITDLHAYLILISAAQLDELFNTKTQEVAVLDSRNGYEIAGYADMTSDVFVDVPTEHGRLTVGAATAADLRKGMIFTTGEKIDGGRRSDRRKLVVFRALTDFDPAAGTVARHIVTRYWDEVSAADKAALSSTMTGADNVINLVVNRGAVLTQMHIADIAAREYA